MVFILVEPTSYLAPVETTTVENLDFMPSICQLHGGDHACQTASDDTNTHLFGFRNLNASALKRLAEECGVVTKTTETRDIQEIVRFKVKYLLYSNILSVIKW